MIRNAIHRGVTFVVRTVRGDGGGWEWRGQYNDDGKTELVLPYEYEQFDDPDDALDDGESFVRSRIDDELE